MAKKSNKDKLQKMLDSLDKDADGVILTYVESAKMAIVLVPFKVTKASFKAVAEKNGTILTDSAVYKNAADFAMAHGMGESAAPTDHSAFCEVGSVGELDGGPLDPISELPSELAELHEAPFHDSGDRSVDIVGGRPVNNILKPGDTVCLLSDPGRHFTVVMQADNFVSLSFINELGKIDFTASPLDVLGKV